jgi:hypothetical protein
MAMVNFPLSSNDLTKDKQAFGSLGISLQLFIGPLSFAPAPDFIIQSIKSIEVIDNDNGRDGFQISFNAGRSSRNDLDDPLVSSPLLKPFTRVIIMVNFGIIQRVLIDGIITLHQYSPSDSPGKSTFTVTGVDYSILMDMVDFPEMHPAQPDYVIVNKIILRYGLLPIVIHPPQINVPNPLRHIPTKLGTDYAYILQLAQKYHFIFCVEPTDTPGVNNAYWGPSVRAGVPQRAITVDMGPATNVSSPINFQNNALLPRMVFGLIQDELTQNTPIPVIVPMPLPPYCASEPAHIFNIPHVKSKITCRPAKGDVLNAYIQAYGEVDASKDVITATGKLDTLRYGDILRARGIVSVRGVGYTHDGLYYVKSVTHRIERGSYTQDFSLTREGNGSIVPGVMA